MNKEFRKHSSSNGRLFSYNCAVETKIDSTMTFKEVSAGNHIIQRIGNDFYFVTKGILLDQHLIELAAKQPNQDQQRVIIIQGLILQYNQIGWN